MVFEAVVVDLLNRFLNKYVENLDISQLKIGIWGGNVVLNDLKIKSTIFDEFNVPVRVKWGKLGRLSLKIPWKNLYSAPAVIEVEELLMVVIPFMEFNYDPVKEEKWNQEKKQAKLAAIEEAKKRELEESPDKKDGFLEKLLTQIIKNLQVVIKDIHVRYEDKITIPDSPFSVGVTLSKLSCESTANDTTINYSKFMEGKNFICKKVDLKGLSIYWNSDSELFSDYAPDKLRKILIETIPTNGDRPKNLMFLFGPLSASAFLRLNPKPENDGSNFTIPKIFVNVHLKAIELGITSSQFCDALSYAEEFERFLAATKYRKFRPKGIPVHGHCKEWWSFAYTAVLDDIIRRRREWSWSHIREHRRICKEYSRLFKLKLTSKKMFPEDVQQLQELENKLNVLNLVLIREQVYVQVERIDKEKKSTGWFGNWFGTGSDSKDDSQEEELVRKIQRVMTTEEKEKLYKAIGYEESGSPANYPLRFVEIQFWFHLDEMKAVVYDNKTEHRLKKIEPILSVSLKSIKMELEERPAFAVKFVLIIGRFHVIGKQEKDGSYPELVTSTCQESESLIELLYEMKPLNSPYDVRLIVNAQPLKIIFHAETVNVVRDTFNPPSSQEIDKIVAATSASLPTFRKITAVGLQYAIEKRTEMELQVNMLSSLLIVPYEGVYRPEKEMLVLILGSLNVETEQTTSKKVDVRKMFLEGTTDEEIFSTVLSASYTNFKCRLTGVQVLFQLSGEDWVTASQTPKSSMQFLEQTNLELTIKKSLVMDDARIPKIIIEAQVPSLALNFSEERFLGFVALASSISMQTKRPPPTVTKKGLYASSWSVINYQIENTLMTVEKNLNQMKAGTTDYVQGIDFVGNFLINEMIVNVTKTKHIKHEEEAKGILEKRFLNLQVSNLGVELTIKTFENISLLKLGGIRCNQYHNKEWLELVAPTGEGNEYLFLGQYINLDTKIPDFYTAKNAIVNRLTLTMTALKVVLDSARILAVLEFVANVQRKAERLTEKFNLDRMADAGKEIETIHEEENVQADKKVITKGKRFRKKSPQKEVIDFFLQANLDAVNIFLHFENRGIAKFSLEGGSVEISIRKSYLTLDVKVHDISLYDLHPLTKHPKIVKALEDETVSSRVTVYDKEYFGTEDTIDMSVEAEVGGIECTFVRIFFVRIIAFLSGFQSQVETLKQGATIAAQKAKENVVKAFHNAAKICVNVKITAPLLLIPRSSVSLEALEIDLGVLTVRNSVTELDYSPEQGAGSRPVIDLIKFHLDNLKMGRRVLSEDGLSKIRVKTFLVPVTFDLTVKRNLSRMWFRVIPEIEILARLATIRITLTNDDLCVILNILRENIKEEDEHIKYQHSSTPKSKAKAPAKSTKGLFEHHQELMLESGVVFKQDAKDENFYTIVKFIFFLESFIFDTKTTTPGSEEEVGLGRFVLQAMSAKGRLFSNDSIYTAMQLEHCFVDDTRPGDENRLTRFLEPADNTDLVDSSDKGSGGLHMLEVIFQTQGQDSFFDIRVYRFRLVISMDYLKRLLEFFSVQSATPPEEVKLIAKSEMRKGGVSEAKMGDSTFTVNISLEKPDIILVENLNSFNVDALVFHTELVMKYRCAGERKILTGTLSDIELDACSFNHSEGLQTLNQVIKPFMISVAGSTPEGSGLHVDVCVTDIFICVDPSTVNLISNCFQALMEDSSITPKCKTEKDYSDLWDVKPFSKDEYTFLQTEVGVDAVRRLSIRSSPDTSEIYNEICLLSIPSLIILIEGEQTRHAEPFVLVQMGFTMRCYNWSENMSILNSLQLEMKYFNKRVFDWEPLIEPVEKVSESNLRHSYIPWELNCTVIYSGEGEFEDLRPPQVQVTLSSKETLPITITKTFVDLLKYATDKYTTAVKKHKIIKVADLPPFVIKNETGETLELLLDESELQLYRGLVKEYKFVKLDSNSEVELQSIPRCIAGTKEKQEHLWSERTKAPLFVKFPGVANSIFEVSIEKPFKRYHPFTTNSDQAWVFETDVSVARNSTLIVFRSICTIKNYFNEPINVHILSENNDEAKYVGTVEGNSTFTLPFKDVHDKNQKLFFSVNGYSLCLEPFAWNTSSNDVNNSCLLQCTSKVPENSDPFFIQAYTEKKMIYYGNTNRKTLKSGVFKIHLQPTVRICNSLMFPLVLCFQGSAKEEILKPGNSSQISNAEPGTTSVTLRIDDYLDKQWSCRETIPENPSEFLIWEFASYSGLSVENLNLGVHVTNYRKTAVYTVYCPYLMINKTGYLLSYKFEGSSTVFFHPGELVFPIMLSPGPKKFFSKKMANLKVERSGWSDEFSLDVAGSGGTVECTDPTTNMVYKISVTISLSQNSMARMVVLTPFYVLINSTDYIIEYQECISDNEPWMSIPSHDCVPFWPRSQEPSNTIRIRPEKSEAVTPEFAYQSTDVILLRLPNKYGGINTSIKVTNSGTYITFTSYEYGQAPILLLNYCKAILTIKEVNTEYNVVLKPEEQVMHSWLRPTGKRTLVVQDDQNQSEEIEVNEDGTAWLFCEGSALRYVCFLDGSQRMVLFTEDLGLSESISSSRLTTSGVEIVSKIHGIGVSLVNDLSRLEILYAAFFSSGVSWESKQPGKRRFKVMKKEDSALIESAYQKFIEMPDSYSDTPISAGGKYSVNFEKMEIVEPFVKELKRTFEPGLWLVYRQMEDYVMVHMKVHKVQVDSQLLDCIFPVVLGAVPPPKTVASLFQDPKPFFELSVVRVGTDRKGVLQYKYFKSLMQEFHVKLDIGLMHQLYCFVMPLETPEEQEKMNFKKDLNFVEQRLTEFVKVVSTEDRKNFFDLLHFSPLKIHFSFSVGGKMDESKQYIPPFMSVMLQSVGATLTDIHDVVFRLSCLERKACFLTNRELKHELMSHYTGQIVRQAYVLLLGLDVIGNPFGLIVGIGEGMEAFFYEPFQGMIRGPSEFGRGVAIGWKRMFGHTVGSAAGTLGKLTDSLGKGLAVLSLDEEYQMKRMTERSAHASVQTQMARGGRGLVMGVVEGVTGVVQKPIKGACKEGLGGFVKGMGKGMMGLITRPVTGIVDFATTSFYAVNRTTLVGAKNERLRPPRYIRDYEILQPFYLREAQGYLIFFELARQKYFSTDKYEYHLGLRNKEIIVLTDKRIILAEFSDVFGTWQEHTTITWDLMPQQPQLHPKGIALSIPKHNKAETKILVVEDAFVKDEAFTKMVTLYRNEKENPDNL